MLRLSRSIKQTQSLISLQPSRSLSISAIRMSDKIPLDADHGSVGKQFQPDGKVGSTAQQVGGPFDKEGAVGKQFTKDGAIGGTGQAAAEQIQGDKKPLFDKDGAIGKQFKADGAIGSVGQAVGGPFAADGAVGKNFNPEGAVGGTIHENLGTGKK
ncbi:hypothetical protein PV11_04397 [Exophiala sideris]|uniref:Uncharacterized protein n=1 Tax=Exophiala sideris TaxID=1016849 RepID=A0A0D1X3V4_9EURO|nr:hypothetical protein PV11_04397 [Exophiala sideris]